MSGSLEQFAFSADQVCELTGLSRRQLRYWDQTGFFAPEYSAGHSRVYSFRDLVGLRTVAKLRRSVPLQELRKVGAWLKTKHQTPWASLRFYLSGRTVHFKDPASQRVMTAKPPEQTVCVTMEQIVHETRQLVEQRRRRQGSDVGRIERQRSVVQNSPVLAGTRIPVDAIWNFFCAGYSTKQILEEYPSLTRKDVKAAIEFSKQHQGRQAS
jgi:DNA-binding transcriptional MerR regulator